MASVLTWLQLIGSHVVHHGVVQQWEALLQLEAWASIRPRQPGYPLAVPDECMRLIPSGLGELGVVCYCATHFPGAPSVLRNYGPRRGNYKRSGCDTPGWRVGGGSAGGSGGGGGRLEGGGGWPWGGGGVPKVGEPTRDPLLAQAYLMGGCVSGAGLGKLLVAVVKQRLQMSCCVHSGCGDLHFATFI